MSITDFDYIHNGVKENEDLDELLRKRRMAKNIFGDVPPEIAELAMAIAKQQMRAEKEELEKKDPYDHAMEGLEPPKKDDRFDY